jgi:hypothetical protein
MTQVLSTHGPSSSDSFVFQVLPTDSVLRGDGYRPAGGVFPDSADVRGAVDAWSEAKTKQKWGSEAVILSTRRRIPVAFHPTVRQDFGTPDQVLVVRVWFESQTTRRRLKDVHNTRPF